MDIRVFDVNGDGDSNFTVRIFPDHPEEVQVKSVAGHCFKAYEKLYVDVYDSHVYY